MFTDVHIRLFTRYQRQLWCRERRDPLIAIKKYTSVCFVGWGFFKCARTFNITNHTRPVPEISLLFDVCYETFLTPSTFAFFCETFWFRAYSPINLTRNSRERTTEETSILPCSTYLEGKSTDNKKRKRSVGEKFLHTSSFCHIFKLKTTFQPIKTHII